MSSFELTPDKILLNAWVTAGAAIVSGILCVFVLIAAACIRRHPTARHHIDRISFRLVLWTMGFQLIYDITCLVAAFYTNPNADSETSCIAGVYMNISTMTTVNYLITFIAINLMLIICFRVNPARLGLEKWYVGLSILLGMGIPIIPAAIGHFGVDPVLGVCWIKGRADARLVNLIVDMYLWQVLTCAISTVAIAITIVSVIRQHRRTSRAMFISNTLNVNGQEGCGPSQRGNAPTGPPSRVFDDYFLKTAFKISFYPLLLIVTSAVYMAADLTIASAGGVYSQGVYILYGIYCFLFGGRGIFFALLGIFVDPCLRNGLRESRRSPTKPSLPPFVTQSGEEHNHNGGGNNAQPTCLRSSDYDYVVSGCSSSKESKESDMPLPALSYVDGSDESSDSPPHSRHHRHHHHRQQYTHSAFPKHLGQRRESTASHVEITDALSALPNPDDPSYYPSSSPAHKARPTNTNAKGKMERSESQTLSFIGVASDSLPSGMTDDVDADLSLEAAPWRRPSQHDPSMWRPGAGIGEDEDLRALSKQL